MNRHFYTKQRQCIKMLALVSIMYYMLYINRSATQDLKVSPEGPRKDHQVKWRPLIAWLQCSVLQSRHSCEWHLTCATNPHTVKDREHPLMATAFTDGGGAPRNVKKRLMCRPGLQISQIQSDWTSIRCAGRGTISGPGSATNILMAELFWHIPFNTWSDLDLGKFGSHVDASSSLSWSLDHYCHLILPSGSDVSWGRVPGL